MSLDKRSFFGCQASPEDILSIDFYFRESVSEVGERKRERKKGISVIETAHWLVVSCLCPDWAGDRTCSPWLEIEPQALQCASDHLANELLQPGHGQKGLYDRLSS